MKRITRLPPVPFFRMAGLIAVSVLLASVAYAVNNPHYDANATTGGLHKVCKEFSISNQAVLEAECNKKQSEDSLSLVTDTIDLLSNIEERCRIYYEIRPQADKVLLVTECRHPTWDSVEETQDLGTLVEWDVTDGKFSIKGHTLN